MVQILRMTARLGADDLDFVTASPALLRDVSGIEPAMPLGMHVLLDEHGVRSMQRLALGDLAGGILAALWPGELKSQALYLYKAGRGQAVVAAARERGWTAAPSPHMGFFNSQAALRLYMAPDIDATEYARRWEETDTEWIRQFPREDVRDVLWPWLKERGYANAGDDWALEQFLAGLGRRPAHMRPGLRLKRRWDAETIREFGGHHDLALAIRSDVNAILAAAGEPPLPATSK
jgi:hypothetical protein